MLQQPQQLRGCRLRFVSRQWSPSSRVTGRVRPVGTHDISAAVLSSVKSRIGTVKERSGIIAQNLRVEDRHSAAYRDNPEGPIPDMRNLK
jgi:hypothetical protein